MDGRREDQEVALNHEGSVAVILIIRPAHIAPRAALHRTVMSLFSTRPLVRFHPPYFMMAMRSNTLCVLLVVVVVFGSGIVPGKRLSSWKGYLFEWSRGAVFAVCVWNILSTSFSER